MPVKSLGTTETLCSRTYSIPSSAYCSIPSSAGALNSAGSIVSLLATTPAETLSTTGTLVETYPPVVQVPGGPTVGIAVF